jgi:capsular polysaccharide biosynthesis protein
VVGTAADPAPVRELADYVRPVRRRWRWLVIGAAVGLVVGLIAAAIAPHRYTSTASVVVTPTDLQQDVNSANGRTQDVINLDTEAQIVKSDAVAARVRRVLHAHSSLAAIERRVSVTVPANTTVLRISYTAGSPGRAAAGAQAYATSYLAVRASTAKRVLRSQEAAVRKQIAVVANELTLRNTAPATSARQRSLRAVRYRALANESSALAKQLSTLATTVITPGNVIEGATVPSGGAGRWLLFLLSGAMIGLLVAAGGAAAADRTDMRFHEPRDLEESGIGVVGAVDTPANAMRTYRRARTAILDAPPGGGGVVLVAGPTWEARDDEVASNVATAILDHADSVALVRVADGSVGLTQLGARGEAEATRRGGRASEGAKGSATFDAATRAGLRQSLERLKKDTDWIVVDASDPLAESVLSVCDSALLVVSRNATQVPDIVEAVHEMEREGIRVLGVVVTPGLEAAGFGRATWASVLRLAGDVTGRNDALPASERTSSQA